MKAILPEIERVFQSLNKSLFGDKLRVPVFTLAPSKKGVVRFVAEDFEVVIGYDIAKVDTDAFLLHLLHEMVHQANFQKGVVDCRQGQYHNVKFRNAALSIGLSVSRDRSHGWGLTSLLASGDDASEPLLEARQSLLEALVLAKMNEKLLKEVQKKIVAVRKRTFFLKYECNCLPPHNSIRSGRRPDGDHPLNIKCMVCSSSFRCVEFS